MNWRVRLGGRPVAGPLTALAVTDDASLLAVGGDRRATLLDDGGQQLWQSPDTHAPVDELWLTARGRLLLARQAGAIAAFDTTTGRGVPLPPTFQMGRSITGGTLSPDARRFAVTARAGSLQVLDLESGSSAAVACPQNARVPAWRPGTGQVWFVVGDRLYFWESTTPETQPRHAPALRTGTPSALVWSRDGTRLGVVSAAGTTVFVVDRGGLRSTGVLAGARHAAFGADGQLVAVSGSNIAVYNRDLVPLEGPRSRIPACLTVAAAHGPLAFGGADGSIEVWDCSPPSRPAASIERWAAAMARSVGHVADPSPVGSRGVRARRTVLGGSAAANPHPPFGWSPDGETCYLQTAIGVIGTLRSDGSTRWEVLPGLRTQITDLAVDPTGRRIAVTSAPEEGVAAVLDAATGAVLARIPAGQGVAWHPNGSRLALAAPRHDPRSSPRPGIQLIDEPWNAVAGTAHVETLTVDGGVGRFAYSPDGTLLAAAGAQVYVWAADGAGAYRRVARLHAPGAGRAEFTRVAFSPDGGLLAASPVKGEPAVVWRTDGWQYHRSLGTPGGFALAPALAWSPDSRILAFPAAGRESRVVELWDVEYGRLIGVLDPPAPEWRNLWTIAWCTASGRLAATHSPGHAGAWNDIDAVSLDAPGRGLDPERRDVLARLAAAAAESGSAVSLDRLSALLELFESSSEHGDDLPRAVAAVRELRWPARALIGLAVLAADSLTEAPLVRAPRDAAHGALVEAADAALSTPRASATDAAPPRAPLSAELAAAPAALDGRTLALLRLVGPWAVAADPLLPARLRGLHLDLLPPNPHDRTLSGLRVPWSEAGGGVEGAIGGDGLAGLARRGPVRAQVSSQLARDPDLLALRAVRGELMYRTWRTTLPARVRPVISILDDTAAAADPVGLHLRLVAHLVAVAMLALGLTADVLTLAGDGRAAAITDETQLEGIWAPVSVQRADLPRALRQADAAAARWSAEPGPAPRIALLTHEHRQVPQATPGGRALDVVRARYPTTRRPAADTGPWILSAAPTASQLRAVVLRLLGP